MRPVLDYLNWRFSYHYVPRERITLDESLVGMKNRNPVQQYIPNKKLHKWGAKLYCVAEVRTGYTYRIRVHNKLDNKDYDKLPSAMQISNPDEITKNITNIDRLILHMLEGEENRPEQVSLLGKGYDLFTDNYYTSVPIASLLIELDTTYTGTLRRNRRFIPQAIKKQLPVGSDMHMRKGHLLVSASREKKSQKLPCLFLSSAATANDVEITRDSGKKVTVPEVVSQYIIGMKGCDQADQMIYEYADDRRSYRWYRKLFCNFVHRAVLNAYIIYVTHRNAIANAEPNIEEREEFIERVIAGLINGTREVGFAVPCSRASSATCGNPSRSPSQSPSRSPNPSSQTLRTRQHAIHKLESGMSKNGKPIKKERDCVHCSVRSGPNKKRKRTTYECKVCDKGVCPDCFDIHESSKPLNM